MGFALTIDEGNSFTKKAWWEGETMLSEHPAAGAKVDAVIVSSVNPSSKLPFVYSNIAERFLMLTANTPLPFKVDYEANLGPDRIAAAAGAFKLAPGLSVLIADIGTALTCDFLSADGHFKGGIISPGIEMRLKALANYTAALPNHVDPEGSLPLLGHNTAEAMRAGAVRGVVAEIRYYHEELSQSNPTLITILTGGGASLVAKHLNMPFIFEPDLVHIGLKCILDHNENN